MNINKLIDRLKKRIGLNGVLKDVYSDKVLYDSIVNVSLNTLNNVHGFSLRGQLDSFVGNWGINATSNQARMSNDPAGYGVANYNDCIMNIPEDLMARLKMIGSEVRSVYMTTSRRPTYMTPMAGDIREELIGLNRNAQYRRNYSKPTLEFKYPNVMVLKNYVNNGRFYRNSGYDLFIQCTHPRNLSTISRGVSEFFENLCMLDIMINIYNNELSMLNVDLGSSRVDLSLEHFTSASGNRETLLKEFKEKAAIDAIRIF